jgi:sec-independent protein translocase protein TatC
MLKIKDIDQTQAPLLDHLVELRTRLLRCVTALALAFAVCFYFADEIFALLVRPLASAFPEGTDARLVYTKLYEAFFVEIKVALFAAFFVTFPIIANQLWAFVAPGLYAKEKRAFLPFLLATPVLFIAGASLAYFVVMPTAFRWFLGFQGEVVAGLSQEALPAMGDYLDLVMRFILAFGISFLLPVLMLLLNRAGLITREQVRHLAPLRDRGDLHHRRGRDAARRGLAADPGDPADAAVRRLAAADAANEAGRGRGERHRRGEAGCAAVARGRGRGPRRGRCTAASDDPDGFLAAHQPYGYSKPVRGVTAPARPRRARRARRQAS